MSPSLDYTGLRATIATRATASTSRSDRGHQRRRRGDDGSESDDELESTRVATDTGPNGDDSGDGSTSGGELEDLDALYKGALDITATGLQMNQGIAIIDADRHAGRRRHRHREDHARRRTIAFGTWTLAPSFAARTSRRELHPVHADATRRTLVFELSVSGPSGPGQSDAHFTWTIEPGNWPRARAGRSATTSSSSRRVACPPSRRGAC